MVANELALVLGLGEGYYTWGRRSASADRDAVRFDYLEALRVADRSGDYRPLLTVARS